MDTLKTETPAVINPAGETTAEPSSTNRGVPTTTLETAAGRKLSPFPVPFSSNGEIYAPDVERESANYRIIQWFLWLTSCLP